MYRAKFVHTDEYLSALTPKEKQTPYWNQVIQRVLNDKYPWATIAVVVRKGLMLFANEAEKLDWLSCQQGDLEVVPKHSMSGANSCHGTWKTRHAGQ